MKQPGLICAVSNISDGNMALKWGEEKEVWRNRKRFLAKNGISVKDCVFTSLVHGTEIKIVNSYDKEKILEADGFITSDKHVAIWITTGDCFPIVFFDAKKKILGLAHLGWRGVDKGLAGEMVKRLIDLGVDPGNVWVWIGPGIRKESYVFDTPLKQENDPRWQPFLERWDGGKTAIDVVGLIEKQLADFGVKHVEDCGIDTAKDENYFSENRSDELNISQGRFATVVMMV